jgi:putative signal transducing protein
MIKLYSPENEVQLAILKSLFEAEGIPIFVHNDNFGSMRTGIQIELLNQKTIMVSEQDYENARTVIRNFLGNIAETEQEQETTTASYALFDKIRMVFEGLFFGWVMPGRKWRKDKKP